MSYLRAIAVVGLALVAVVGAGWTLTAYGKQHLEIAKRRESKDDDENDEDDGGGNNNKQQQLSSAVKNNSMVISREKLILLPDPEMNYSGNNNLQLPNSHTNHVDDDKYSEPPTGKNGDSSRHEFELADCMEYIRTGVEAIIEDQVTSRFEAEELRSWNLLTRTNHNYEFLSWRLTVIWVFGFIMRYTFLLPIRIFICLFGLLFLVFSTALTGFLPNNRLKRYLAGQAMVMSMRIMMRALSVVIDFHQTEHRPQKTLWLTLCMAAVGYFPDGSFKRWLNKWVCLMCFGMLSSAISADVEYHNVENRPKTGICVANHTSPIDVLVLACDNTYSLIGQRHGGFLGILQRALARASPHIWFERSEVKDREAVADRLKEHVSDPNNPPILIFPEGTCINNTSVMQFKKGSFEVGSVIYPVAIKYDPRFGDAFWNSSKYSMIQYLYCMMTSWAIVCDVWYLPPMQQKQGESSIDFANRVKRAIAQQGGLVDLMWDGQLKRSGVKKEWKEKQQEEFSKRLKVE